VFITIKCEECGNEHQMKVPARKYIQFRDNLEKGGFSYFESNTKIKEGRLQELMIHCKCGNYMFLGVD